MAKEYAAAVDEAVKVMREGGIILYPTDTIWGVGCSVSCEAAVKRIFELKRRSDSKSMLMLLDSEAKLNYYVPEVPDLAYDLMDLSTKPLTIIYDSVRNVATQLLAEDGSMGIRITAEEFSRELCRKLGGGVVSTSANISGEPAPASFSEITPEIKNGVDYVVPWRQAETVKARPSSIVKLGVGGLVKVIRE